MRGKVGPWMWNKDHAGMYRALIGTDGERLENRVAFIEQTPRVRIRDMSSNYGGIEAFVERTAPPGVTQYDHDVRTDWLHWAYAPYKGQGPDDLESQRWCDLMLLMLGYDL